MRVYVADTAVEAVAHVRALMPSSGLVVKSKSNLGKELHLAEALTDAGLTVIETDLGDRINQMAGTTGFHVLSPAASIDRFQVRDLFSRELGEELGDSPEELVAAARRSLRGYFARADYGLVGANAIAADTGSVCLMENENIRAAWLCKWWCCPHQIGRPWRHGVACLLGLRGWTGLRRTSPAFRPT